MGFLKWFKGKAASAGTSVKNGTTTVASKVATKVDQGIASASSNISYFGRRAIMGASGDLKKLEITKYAGKRLVKNELKLLIAEIKNNKIVEHIQLDHCEMTDDILKQIADALKEALLNQHSYLSSIDLSNNQITNKGLIYLLNLMVETKRLVQLKLDNNRCDVSLINTINEYYLFKIEKIESIQLLDPKESLNIDAQLKLNELSSFFESIDEQPALDIVRQELPEELRGYVQINYNMISARLRYLKSPITQLSETLKLMNAIKDDSISEAEIEKNTILLEELNKKTFKVHPEFRYEYEMVKNTVEKFKTRFNDKIISDHTHALNNKLEILKEINFPLAPNNDFEAIMQDNKLILNSFVNSLNILASRYTHIIDPKTKARIDGANKSAKINCGTVLNSKMNHYKDKLCKVIESDLPQVISIQQFGEALIFVNKNIEFIETLFHDIKMDHKIDIQPEPLIHDIKNKLSVKRKETFEKLLKELKEKINNYKIIEDNKVKETSKTELETFQYDLELLKIIFDANIKSGISELKIRVGIDNEFRGLEFFLKDKAKIIKIANELLMIKDDIENYPKFKIGFWGIGFGGGNRIEINGAQKKIPSTANKILKEINEMLSKSESPLMTWQISVDRVSDLISGWKTTRSNLKAWRHPDTIQFIDKINENHFEKLQQMRQ